MGKDKYSITRDVNIEEYKEKFNPKTAIWDRALNMAPGGAQQLGKRTALAGVVGNCIDWDYPDFLDLYEDVSVKVKKMLGTRNDVILVAGALRTAVDGLIAGLTEPGDKALVVSNGYWGKMFTQPIEIYGGKPVTYYEEYEVPVNPEKIRKILAREKDIKYVTMVHNETANGIINPLGRDPTVVGEICEEHDALFILDVANSPGNEKLELDRFKVDCAETGTQKIPSPPGIGIVTVSERAWEVIEERKTPVTAWYTDLRRWREYFLLEGKYRVTLPAEEYVKMLKYTKPTGQWVTFTFPVSLLLQLNSALDEYLEEGLKRRLRRHEVAGTAIRGALMNMGLELVPDCEKCMKYTNSATIEEACSSPRRFCSNNIFCPKYPKELPPYPEKENGEWWRDHLDKKYNIYVAPCPGRYLHRAFRMCTMSNVQMDPKNIIATLAAFEVSLREFDVPIEPGSSLKGLEKLIPAYEIPKWTI